MSFQERQRLQNLAAGDHFRRQKEEIVRKEKENEVKKRREETERQQMIKERREEMRRQQQERIEDECQKDNFVSNYQVSYIMHTWT
jgi:hypothetical protein